MTGALKSRAGKLGRLLTGVSPIIVLIALLNALGWLLLSDNYTSFLHPRFWPFLLLGILILAGFILALFLGRPLFSANSSRETAVRSIVIIVPLIFLYTVYDQGMGGHALSKKYTGNEPNTPYIFSDGPPEETIKKSADGRMSLLEMNRQMATLSGRQVLTEGFAYKDSNVPKDHLLLFRFAIFCCAADATPVWVFVKKAEMETFEPETWVKVSGTFEIADINGKAVPMILADTITELEPPSPGAQYLFF